MADNVTFRDAPTPQIEQPQAEVIPPDMNKPVSGETDSEPIEIRESSGGSVVLDALGISDSVKNLTYDDQKDLQEVKSYVTDILKAKGLSETVTNFRKSLDEVREEMGLATEADPALVIERIAGVVKAWKNLTFVKDPTEKRSLFLKLANMKSSQEMNRLVFEKMEEYKIWQ